MAEKIKLDKLLAKNNKPINYSEKDLTELLSESEIREDIPIEKEPILLDIQTKGYDNYISIFTIGNISCIKGKAKSRKTFASTLLISACLYKNSLKNLLYSRIQGYCLLFDTEQSNFHVYKTIQRISGIRNDNFQDINFFAFSLRQYEPILRIKLIEHCLYNLNNRISYVVIDGIRDLVYDINDQREAIEIVTKLMKWSKELNCHITVILHENKADGNARGHIGTEIQNKCETVLSVSKDGNYSIIRSELTRGQEFEPIRFCIEKTKKCFIPVIDLNYEETF